MADGANPADKPAIPQGMERASKLIDALWNDKDVGPSLRKKAKEMFNDITLPDDTMEPSIAPLREQLADMSKRLKDRDEADDKRRTEESDRRTRANLEDALSKARKDYRLTDDGFDKMVARMKETGNFSDADAAAAWVVSKEPPPASPGPTWGPSRLNPTNVTDEADVRLLHKDPEAYQDKVLNDFISDPDKFVRETFGNSA